MGVHAQRSPCSANSLGSPRHSPILAGGGGERKEKYWKEKTVLAFKHGYKEGRLKAPSTTSTLNYASKTSHRA